MEYVLLGFLFVLSAFFSGSETALTSVNKFRLESKARGGDKKAQKVLKLVDRPEKMLTAILIGNNFVNILLAALATAIMISHFGTSGILYSTFVLTVCLLVFSEITPKSIAAVYSERMSYVVVLPITLFLNFLNPIVYLFSMFTHQVIGILSKRIKKEHSVSTDDIRMLVRKGSREGVFQSDEMRLLTSVLDFKNKEATDAMKTPRVDIVSIPNDATFEKVREIIEKERYSRYPVYEEDAENIVGFFYAKDFVSWSLHPGRPMMDYVDKDVLFVPESKHIGELFKDMQEQHKHIAILIDEYSGLTGLISLEDIIEEMIGYDINDEKDEKEIQVERTGEQAWSCAADMKLEKLSTILSLPFSEECDTLGEFVLEMLEKIPQENDHFLYQGHVFTVHEMEKNRMLKIDIRRHE